MHHIDDTIVSYLLKKSINVESTSDLLSHSPANCERSRYSLLKIFTGHIIVVRSEFSSFFILNFCKQPEKIFPQISQIIKSYLRKSASSAGKLSPTTIRISSVGKEGLFIFRSSEKMFFHFFVVPIDIVSEV
jgi:hypothetical protein